MSECWNCGVEITLKDEEIKCDNCKKEVNFQCHKCRQWFSIADKNGEKIKECVYCGFFKCPNCNICGIDCESDEYKKVTLNIIQDKQLTDINKSEKITDYFGDIKVGKDRRECFKGVPISYAKGRIKSSIIRMMGYRTKDNEDMEKFKERLEKIMDIKLGETITINQSREKGSYGQEFRDAFNYAVCLGKLQKIKVTKMIDGEEVEFDAYKRVENGHCPYLNIKDLIVKECPNKDCKIKIYPESEQYCICPECKYKKGEKRGQLRLLKIKISNKDTCQLSRGDFNKR